MDLETALNHLAQDPAAPLDLAEVALLLARDEYPDLDIEAYLSELAGMAHEVRSRLRGSLEGQVRGLCWYLFHEMGFRGNQEAYYDPRNSYFNDVLDRRTGIPITLSAMTMAVAQRGGLEVVGVGLPGHFIAKAVSGKNEVLFDPYHGGRVLSVEDCGTLVEQVIGQPFEVRPAMLRPVPLRCMISRMLTNLKGIYLHNGDHARAIRTIERLRQLNPLDLQQRRDLGTTLIEAGEYGRAIDHLVAYLEAVSDAKDAEGVQKLLERAQCTVSQWN